MTATGHALVGAMIAAKFHNPLIALPLALASHFALDMVPHWDSGTHWREKTKNRLFYEAALDVVISIIVSTILYGPILGENNFMYLYLCVFVAQSPDWVMAPYLILKNKFPVFKFAYHIGRNTNKKLDKPWGIVTQVVTIVLLYILLFKLF